MQDNGLDTEEDRFKDIFKYYKRKKPPPDCSLVIDVNEDFKGGRQIPPCFITEKDQELAQEIGLLLPSSWKIYSINSHPGLLIICNPFTCQGQLQWIKRCLKEFPCATNKTNLASHGIQLKDSTWWQLTRMTEGRESGLQKKLRWVTLGYHHNWDTKVHPYAMFNPLLLKWTQSASPATMMTPKRKRTQLTVAKKLELLQKLESSWSVARCCSEYGVAKQTTTVGGRKLIRVAQDQRLEDAVFKWKSQHRSSGVALHTLAYLTLMLLMVGYGGLGGGMGLSNKVCGEAASAPTEEIEPFHMMLTELIAREGLLFSQVYNADETGLFWRLLPENTQALAKEHSTRMSKLDKNLRKHDIKAAIFNWAVEWKDVKVLTLSNGWKKLLQGVDHVGDFEGFEMADYHHNLKKAGGNTITEENVLEWLHSDEGDPSFQLMTELEISASCTAPCTAVRAGLDTAIEYLHANTNDPELLHYYSHLRELRDEYSEDLRGEMPPSLVKLCSVVSKVLGFEEFRAEAAIINYYHQDSTLAAHTDHSEPYDAAPLFSFSFGQSAVFLIGGPTKATKPSAIHLHSGDVMVMSGTSRQAYHAVPRIVLVEEEPWNAEQIKQDECEGKVDISDNQESTIIWNNDVGASGSSEGSVSKVVILNEECLVKESTWNKNFVFNKDKTVSHVKRRKCEDVSNSSDIVDLLNYVKSNRINMNVRQVLMPSMHSLPR
ncbi:Nucleic acid dioxygenase ALKBH1-like [Homarus americanus]|uniref:Nucleic acid dioxygenase ALKBH1-like n=1 Tax=Homarus americanus TaxID=6706 RepID=A0A8J5MP40_HOMAM|nr:Nucleic acid dioxygenase ALKBH1-like [Homarus americanus]